MAAPTLVSTAGNNPIITTTPQTVSITVQTGDLVVVKAATDEPTTHLSTPTGGGLTYTLQQSVVDLPSQSNAYVWTATAPSAQTFTLSLAKSSNSGYFTFEAKVWRNHGGVGTSAKRVATSTGSLSITTSGANSAVEVLNSDWQAVDGSTRTWLTSAGAFTETSYQRVSQTLAFYAGHHADTGAVGTYAFGMSAPSGQYPSQIVVEVLAAPVAATGSLSITAATMPSNVPPAIQVSINDTRSPGQASSLTVMRINPDGTRSPVRTSDGNALPLASGVGVVYDYEAPFGAAVSYTTVEVPGVTSLQVTSVATQPWLIHPGQPALSVPINLRPGSLQTASYTVTQGSFWVMGRANPIVVTDGARKGAASSLVLVVQSQQDLNALMALLSSASVLLLNPPDGTWGMAASYIAVGNVTVARWTAEVIDDNRDVTLPFQVVDRPAGGSQAQRTYADILAAYGTYAAVQAAYPTYLQLLTGP